MMLRIPIVFKMLFIGSAHFLCCCACWRWCIGNTIEVMSKQGPRRFCEKSQRVRCASFGGLNQTVRRVNRGSGTGEMNCPVGKKLNRAPGQTDEGLRRRAAKAARAVIGKRRTAGSGTGGG